MEPYIPHDAQWYLAEIIEEITIDQEPQNVVHINTVLVHAGSPDDAYEKAIVLGQESEGSYENTDGQNVTITFRGLRDLNVIHEELEHGAELIYEEEIGMTPEQIAAIVRSKTQLAVFRAREPVRGPNYLSREIAEAIQRSATEQQAGDQGTPGS